MLGEIKKVLYVNEREGWLRGCNYGKYVLNIGVFIFIYRRLDKFWNNIAGNINMLYFI